MSDWLHTGLSGYLRYGRRAYLELERQIRPTCDLVVAGTLTLEVTVDVIRQAAQRLRLI